VPHGSALWIFMLEIFFSHLKSLAASVIVFASGAVALVRGGDRAWMITVLIALFCAAFYIGRVICLAVRRQWGRELSGSQPVVRRSPLPDSILAVVAALMYFQRGAAITKLGPASATPWVLSSLFVFPFIAGYLVTRQLRLRAEAKAQQNTPL
jgi:hypothetical protein